MEPDNESTGREPGERGKQLEILLIEDDEDDVRLVEEAFSDASLTNGIRVVRGLDEARPYLDGRDEYAAHPPDIVLVNTRLAATGGEDALSEFVGSVDIPVVPIASTEGEVEFVDDSTHPSHGALTKPLDPTAFIDLARGIDDVWVSVVKRRPE